MQVQARTHLLSNLCSTCFSVCSPGDSYFLCLPPKGLSICLFFVHPHVGRLLFKIVGKWIVLRKKLLAKAVRINTLTVSETSEWQVWKIKYKCFRLVQQEVWTRGLSIEFFVLRNFGVHHPIPGTLCVHCTQVLSKSMRLQLFVIWPSNRTCARVVDDPSGGGPLDRKKGPWNHSM